MHSLSRPIWCARPRRALAVLFVSMTALLNACGGASASGQAAAIDCPVAQQAAGAVDCVMRQFMASSGVTAATIAIVHHDQLLLEQGYGHQDAAATIALPANALMLTASIVKPVTAAAIQRLASAGKLALSDHAFCNGRNAPCWLAAGLTGAGADARAADITILHLLSMTAGFDPAVSGDPITQEAAIRQSLRLSAPPQRTDIIGYRMARALDFAPGARYAYANFSYLVLGQIIEQASGMGYVAYVNEAVFQPLGVAGADFRGAASLIKDHDPREPNYICSETGASTFVPGATVKANDGVIHAPNWVSVGFALTTAKAMAQFGARYQIWGGDAAELPTAGTGTLLRAPLDQFAFGKLCGSQTILRQRRSGASYAVLLNKSDGFEAATLMVALDRVLDQLQR
ncbi:serine hydrolase domain-containing protein [Massilia sp. S19_KUP03_FR1]|uniref:serine hydrolase domain-containing protein n=1 Tax=Massilia sp. S19_KUP03_FR1 TaxID=3025503 RepID=UPI002FCDD41E